MISATKCSHRDGTSTFIRYSSWQIKNLIQIRKKGYAKYIFIFTMAIGDIKWPKHKINKIHEGI